MQRCSARAICERDEVRPQAQYRAHFVGAVISHGFQKGGFAWCPHIDRPVSTGEGVAGQLFFVP
jgi:hypothetical protein